MDETKIFALSLFNFVFLQYEKDLGFQGNRESLNNHENEAKKQVDNKYSNDSTDLC